MSTDVNGAARIPRLAHPKLRTAPREGATPRGPEKGQGERGGTFQELFKRRAMSRFAAKVAFAVARRNALLQLI
jgi:hypothetical protein